MRLNRILVSSYCAVLAVSGVACGGGELDDLSGIGVAGAAGSGVGGGSAGKGGAGGAGQGGAGTGGAGKAGAGGAGQGGTGGAGKGGAGGAGQGGAGTGGAGKGGAGGAGQGGAGTGGAGKGGAGGGGQGGAGTGGAGKGGAGGGGQGGAGTSGAGGAGQAGAGAGGAGAGGAGAGGAGAGGAGAGGAGAGGAGAGGAGAGGAGAGGAGAGGAGAGGAGAGGAGAGGDAGAGGAGAGGDAGAGGAGAGGDAGAGGAGGDAGAGGSCGAVPGDTCANIEAAIAMAEGQTTITGDMVCANNDLAGSCIGALQIDKVFEYVPAASGNVTFTVTTSADLAPGLFVTDACGAGTELACTASGVLTLPVTKGTSIFVGLEALPIGSGPRTYSIVADLTATNPSNKCAAGIPVTSLVVDNAVLLLATTAGSGADISVPTQAGQCTAAQFPDPTAGNDLVFAVKPTQSGTLTLKAKAENPKVLDPVLYVTSTCGDSATSIKCANSSGVGGIETFSIAVTADTVYYAVIDSAGGTTGDVSFTALLTVPLGAASPTLPPESAATSACAALTSATPLGSLNDSVPIRHQRRAAMVTKHVLGLGACLIGTGLLAGCGSDAPDKQGDAQVTWPGAEQAQARVGGGRLRRVATYEAAYTAKTGGFTFKQAAPKYLLPGGQKPQGFKFDSASAFTFATPNAQVGSTGPLSCLSTQLCGSVTVQYNDAGGGNKVDDVWAEIRDLVEPGVSVANSGSIPTGYSPTIGYGQGRFKYGTLTSGAAATAKQWNFNLGAPFDPATQDFYFNVDVYATYIHQSYNKGGTTGVDVDACAGGTVALNAGNGNNSTAAVSLPFPLTIYEKTGAGSGGWVSSNGTFGIGSAIADGFNESLPSTNFNASDPAVFAFWDQLNIASGGQVCYQTAGTAPNRTFTVTWKGMDIAASAPVESMNFSVIAYEGTDVIDFQYSEPSTGVSTDTQGAGSTAGLQGPVNGAYTSIQLWSDAATLPAAGSYPAGFRISPNLVETVPVCPLRSEPERSRDDRPACNRPGRRP